MTIHINKVKLMEFPQTCQCFYGAPVSMGRPPGNRRKKMPDAYLVEIHRFLAEKKKEAIKGLEGADDALTRAFYRGMLNEVAAMTAHVTERYNMAFRDYGEAV